MLANGSSNQSAVRSKDALPIMDDTERVGPEEEGAKVGLEPIEDSLSLRKALGWGQRWMVGGPMKEGLV